MGRQLSSDKLVTRSKGLQVQDLRSPQDLRKGQDKISSMSGRDGTSDAPGVGEGAPDSQSTNENEKTEGSQLSSAGPQDPKNVQELTTYIQSILQQMQDRFTTMSDQIIGRIDDMAARIDDLEHNINDLMVHADQSTERHALPEPK